MAHAPTIALALFAAGVAVSDAAACSCVRPDRVMTNEEYQAWSFERAGNVVQGHITEVHVNEDIVKRGHHGVVATMRVSSIVKGDPPAGDLMLFTGFGGGDCGLAGPLMHAVVRGQDVVLEVRKASEGIVGYAVDICGYSAWAGILRKETPKQ